MCYIDSHKKQKPSYVEYGNRGGGNALPPNVTTEAFVSLVTTIDFIDFWLKFFDQNYLARSNMYIETMQDYLRRSQFQFLNQLVLRNNANNYYMILEVIGA